MENGAWLVPRALDLEFRAEVFVQVIPLITCDFGQSLFFVPAGLQFFFSSPCIPQLLKYNNKSTRKLMAFNA